VWIRIRKFWPDPNPKPKEKFGSRHIVIKIQIFVKNPALGMRYVPVLLSLFTTGIRCSASSMQLFAIRYSATFLNFPIRYSLVAFATSFTANQLTFYAGLWVVC
jgi:hypothetical protein